MFIKSFYESQNWAENLVVFKDFKSQKLGGISDIYLSQRKTTQSTLMGQDEEWKYPIAP